MNPSSPNLWCSPTHTLVPEPRCHSCSWSYRPAHPKQPLPGWPLSGRLLEPCQVFAPIVSSQCLSYWMSQSDPRVTYYNDLRCNYLLHVCFFWSVSSWWHVNHSVKECSVLEIPGTQGSASSLKTCLFGPCFADFRHICNFFIYLCWFCGTYWLQFLSLSNWQYLCPQIPFVGLCS